MRWNPLTSAQRWRKGQSISRRWRSSIVTHTNSRRLNSLLWPSRPFFLPLTSSASCFDYLFFILGHIFFFRTTLFYFFLLLPVSGLTFLPSFLLFFLVLFALSVHFYVFTFFCIDITNLAFHHNSTTTFFFRFPCHLFTYTLLLLLHFHLVYFDPSLFTLQHYRWPLSIQSPFYDVKHDS